MNRKDVFNLYNHLLTLSYWKTDHERVMPLWDFVHKWSAWRIGKPMAFDIEKISMVNGFLFYDGQKVFRFEDMIPPAYTYSAKAAYYEGRILARQETEYD